MQTRSGKKIKELQKPMNHLNIKILNLQRGKTKNDEKENGKNKNAVVYKKIGLKTDGISRFLPAIKYKKLTDFQPSPSNRIPSKIKLIEPKMYHSTPYPSKQLITESKYRPKPVLLKRQYSYIHRLSPKKVSHSKKTSSGKNVEKPKIIHPLPKTIKKHHYRPLTVPKPFSFDAKPNS